VAATRIGASHDGARLVVVDLAGGRLPQLADDAKPRVDAAASQGALRNPVAYRNADTGTWRMSFELHPGGARVSELRARLVDAQGPLSETWLYRWMA
jgi:glucans biosynthesis protein